MVNPIDFGGHSSKVKVMMGSLTNVGCAGMLRFALLYFNINLNCFFFEHFAFLLDQGAWWENFLIALIDRKASPIGFLIRDVSNAIWSSSSLHLTTDESCILETNVWSILLILTDIKWCIKLCKSLLFEIENRIMPIKKNVRFYTYLTTLL